MATAIEEVSRQRRVAQERKKIHDSSEHIYPKSEKTSLSGFHIPRKQNIGSFGTTSYSIDFAKKEGKPALPRPCSVTRRNRPHPSQNFLNWRIPSKPMPGQKTSNVNKAFLNLSAVETRERFYDDYVGKFNMEKCKLCPRNPTRPRLLQRAELEGKTSDEVLPSSLPRCSMPPLCISKDAGQKYDMLVAKTSSKERMIVESCLDAGDRGYLGRSLAYAVRPEAIPAIHQWLKSQNGADRDVVVGFLSNLSKSTTLNQDLEMDKQSRFCTCFDKNTSAEISKAGRDAIIDQVRQMLSKDVRGKRRPQPAKCPPLKKSKNVTRFPMCPPRGFVVNKGALFMQPHRCLPGHFEIHPEFHGVTTK
ncbi:hypothetical protein OS493_032989 [Desmophyllum pertusum]|uniref:Uncharacterized protein n=1 Tax=Desmophyllum pertusum TaxID=174260 RepID=A0A9W9ZXB5_9CNID|nr:hypothetical protein OS493_032989 [Desmophyllum pertusum]